METYHHQEVLDESGETSKVRRSGKRRRTFNVSSPPPSLARHHPRPSFFRSLPLSPRRSFSPSSPPHPKTPRLEAAAGNHGFGVQLSLSFSPSRLVPVEVSPSLSRQPVLLYFSKATPTNLISGFFSYRSATIHAQDMQLEDPVIPVLPSSTRRWILLSLFTTANFLDVWCGSAAFVALAQ